MRNLLTGMLLVVVLLLLAGTALAQNFGNIKPQTVIGNSDPTASKPAAPMPFSELFSAGSDIAAGHNNSIDAAQFTAMTYGWGSAAGGQRWRTDFHPDFGVFQSTLPSNETELQVYTNAANGVATSAGTNQLTFVRGTAFDADWVTSGLPMFYFNRVAYIVTGIAGATLTVKNADGSPATIAATTGVYYYGGVTTQNTCQVAGTAVTTAVGAGVPFTGVAGAILFINGTQRAYTYNSSSSLTLGAPLGTLTNATCKQYAIIDNQLAKIALQALQGADEEAFVQSLHADGLWMGMQYAGAGKYLPMRIFGGEFPAGAKQQWIDIEPNATVGLSGTMSLGGPLNAEAIRITGIANQTNYIAASGSPNGSPPSLQAKPGQFSTDPNLPLNLAGTGTGGVQVQGIAANTPAGAGYIGEVLSGARASGSPLSVVNGTGQNVTSVALTKGHWHCSASVTFKGAGTTTVSNLVASIDAASGGVTEASLGYATNSFPGIALFASGAGHMLTLPPIEVYLAADASRFLNIFTSFGTSTMTAYGAISCLRVQ